MCVSVYAGTLAQLCVCRCECVRVHVTILQLPLITNQTPLTEQQTDGGGNRIMRETPA